ncbi:MAG: RNA polymerase sigma factor, partial [Actinobacteria bacterium]|nr:RNA polymerase sigma factor [Actinomycetota bacterium]
MSSALGTRPAVAGSESDASRPSRRGRGPLARATLAFASDERLAKRAAAGDPDAFATIFRRYGQDLYRFCVGILREPQDAEDAVQNTMMRALRALPGETRDMQLRPWLYRIAHNEAVELRRRRRPAEPLGPTIDIGAGTEDLVEQDARLRTLLADIADLPERQRASLVMRELNGLDFGEIGTALETSPGAARQALYEARRGLSQMEQGRDMDCEKAMRQVSDEDGSPRRRGVRAHLRDCARCRHFQAEIRERKEALAAISPLPLVLVAALAKSSLGGSVGGAAAGAGIGAASAVGVGGGGAGAAAGSVGASTLVKGAAGLLA